MVGDQSATFNSKALNNDHHNSNINRKSESPRVQEILLHQRLHEEIEKNPNGKVRYVNSELYTRNLRQRIPKSVDSEVQSETLDIGLPSSTRPSEHEQSISRIPNKAKQENRNHTKGDQVQQQVSSASALNPAGFGSTTGDSAVGCTDHGHQHKRGSNLSGSASKIDCPVCRIKEVTGDLMNLNKMIQKRNVHFTELKAKFLRPHNVHQMME